MTAEPAPGVEIIRIRYHRPPDRERIFVQDVLDRRPDAVVTLLREADVQRDIAVEERPILQPGAPVVWFTFPDLWHDVGRFHLRDGTFTGYYANVLTPVRGVASDTWETTDLFLDVWVDADSRTHLLDEAEFREAERRGWLDARHVARAWEEAQTLLTAASLGEWPPPICREWTLERARATVAKAAGTESETA